MEPGVIGVVLCDDVPELRALLRAALSAEPDVRVLGEAGDGAAAVDLVREQQPDVVVLDLAMPRMDGLEAIPAIRHASPGTRILVFSGFVADDLEAQVVALGADRYLEKGAPLDEVTRAVRALGGR